jgi:hypothetical protein
VDVDRRSVVKGMAAGGALLWFGAPGWSLAGGSGGGPERFALLLAHGDADAAFAGGARTVLTRAGCRELEVVEAKGGPLADPGALAARMERSRGTRWIAVLDDAGAAIFQELVRGAGGRLLARGHHAASPHDAVPLRHLLVAASPAWSARALLASRLAGTGPRVAITETFLSETGPAPSFRRDDDPDAAGGWVACVGQAVAASALGLRARPRAGGDPVSRGGRAAVPAAQRFASFVVDP